MWVHYVKRFMSNNENLKEDWYGKWWGIISNQSPNIMAPIHLNRNLNQQGASQNANYITKQLKAIREKSKEDHLNREREREREKERVKASQIERERVKASQIEKEREKLKSSQIKSEKSKLRPMSSPMINKGAPKDKQPSLENNPFKHETILKEYDVEFYMKRGLTQVEAIEYIINKLKVSQLWSKMSSRH